MGGRFFYKEGSVLSGVLVQADTIVALKVLLDGYINMQGMEAFGSCASCWVHILWAKEPDPILHCSVFYIQCSVDSASN